MKQYDCIIDQDIDSKSSYMTVTDEGNVLKNVDSQ